MPAETCPHCRGIGYLTAPLACESRNAVGEDFEIHRLESGDKCPMCVGRGWVGLLGGSGPAAHAGIADAIERSSGGPARVVRRRVEAVGGAGTDAGRDLQRAEGQGPGLEEAPQGHLTARERILDELEAEIDAIRAEMEVAGSLVRGRNRPHWAAHLFLTLDRRSLKTRELLHAMRDAESATQH